MSKWIKHKISEIGTVVGGATPSTKDENNYKDGDIAWITPNDLTGYSARYIAKGERNISKKGLESCSTRLLPKHTVLFTSRAPIGYIAIADNELCTNQGFKSVIPNEKVDYLFLYYLLKFNKKRIEAVGSGTTFKEVSTSAMANVEIELPEELDEQHKIANLLNAIDSKIELNNKISALLEEQAKVIYDYWFTQFDFPDENGKPYKSSGGKMVWNEELKREIPDGWEPITVGDITVCHDSERIPLSGNERSEIKGDIPYYGATGIMDFVDRPIFNGDFVLLAEDGSVMDENGHPIIQRLAGPAWVNNHTHVLEPKRNYSCRLLMLILKDIPVAKIKTGSIQMKINQENLNRYKVLDIPEPEKERINCLLSPIDKQIEGINKENNRLSSLRDFLLPLLMNGQCSIEE